MAGTNRRKKGRWRATACVLLLLGFEGATAREIPFRLYAPGAREVLVCGNFREWRCLALHRTRKGLFRRRVAVAPGLYEYGFRVDGRWRLNRRAPEVPDGFGGRDNLLSVGR